MGDKGGVRKFENARGIICHAIIDAREIKKEGLRKNCLKGIAQRQRRSATHGFIVEAFFVLQEMVGVLFEPEQGTASLASGTDTSRVASWRTRAASSKSELVIAPSLFADETRLAMMSDGQGWIHIISLPEKDEYSHTPPAPSPEAPQKPIWVSS